LTNPVVVNKRLGKLREYVKLLRILRDRPRQLFETDPFLYGSAERYIQLAIQVVLDIANHIVADDRLGQTEEYRDAIRLLGEHGYIPPDLTERLLPIAGLRNILVHDYLDIDREKLFGVLQHNLGDLEEFARHIAARL